MPKKIIPKPVFQTIGIAAVFAYIGAILWTYFSDMSTGIVVATVFAGIPLLLVVLGLRQISDMPSVREQLANDPMLKQAKKEAVANDLASPLMRIVAFVIDRTIATLVVFIALLPLMAVSETDAGPIAITLASLFAIVIGIPGIVYAYARDGIGGQSVARRWLKQRVVVEDTRQPIGFGKSFIREILIHVGFVIPFELILMFIRPNRKRIGDDWAKTIVIRTDRTAENNTV